MARKARHACLENRTSRLKLAIQGKPYTGPNLARGITLLYRRNKTNGAWIVKVATGNSKSPYWTDGIGYADDFDEADGNTILTFFEAQDEAKKRARGSGDEADSSTAPVSVDRALTDYRTDLISRGARPYNSDYARKHLTATPLLSKPVAALAARELKTWRDGLIGKLTPASINRLCNSVCAALELARQHDPRIKNSDAWETGLAGLPDAQKARNVIISDAKVHAFVAAGYAKDAALGLLLDTLAVTGTRPSQASRLRVEDLHDHRSTPKLMMPKSGKGGGRNRSAKKLQRYSVPVTVALGQRLKAAAAGRAPEEPLLVQSNGEGWGDEPSQRYREDVREIVAAIGENPDRVSAYTLRHSSIVRMLLKNIPVRLCAALHDTSVGQIEKNYSAHITEHDTDALSRSALLSEPVPAAGNVVALVR